MNKEAEALEARRKALEELMKQGNSKNMELDSCGFNTREQNAKKEEEELEKKIYILENDKKNFKQKESELLRKNEEKSNQINMLFNDLKNKEDEIEKLKIKIIEETRKGVEDVAGRKNQFLKLEAEKIEIVKHLTEVEDEKRNIKSELNKQNEILSAMKLQEFTLNKEKERLLEEKEELSKNNIELNKANSELNDELTVLSARLEGLEKSKSNEEETKKIIKEIKLLLKKKENNTIPVYVRFFRSLRDIFEYILMLMGINFIFWLIAYPSFREYLFELILSSIGK